jgi:hypothetical protein
LLARLAANITLNGPAWWENESSGHLPAAVRALREHPDGLTVQQVACLRAYFHIVGAQLSADTRDSIGTLICASDIERWVSKAEAEGVNVL